MYDRRECDLDTVLADEEDIFEGSLRISLDLWRRATKRLALLPAGVLVVLIIVSGSSLRSPKRPLDLKRTDQFKRALRQFFCCSIELDVV